MDRLIQASVQGNKWITLSEKNASQALEIVNEIEVAIENVSCTMATGFINDLPEGDPIPNIDVKQQQISVIYLYFPIGEGDAYLTTQEWAQKMVCHGPYNWAVEKTIAPDTYGVYFKLYPLSAYTLGPREKMYFSINNVVTFGELEKMVYVAVRFTNVQMVLPEASFIQRPFSEEDSDGTDYLAYFKKRSPLNILDMDVDKSRVSVGDSVKLTWAVAGDPVKCVLTPGDIVVKAVDSIEVEVTTDTEFRLYTYGENSQISDTVMVYVDQPVITKFISDCPDNKTQFKKPVKLSYEVKDGYGVYLNEGIGLLSCNSISVLPNKAETTYVLSCMGISHLEQKSVTITLTDFLEVKVVNYYRGKKTGGLYTYYLQWDVSNCTTIQLKTSDGMVRNTGQASGKMTFTDSATAPLTLTLDCTGTSDQKIHQVYTTT